MVVSFVRVSVERTEKGANPHRLNAPTLHCAAWAELTTRGRILGGDGAV
jgi:hypothetical protein